MFETEGTGTVSGQPGIETASNAITQTGTVSGNGKPDGNIQTTSNGPGENEDSFFDPKDLAPELIPAYKQMQRAFSKKMEGIKDHRAKIEAYDQFQRDPVTQIQQLASQMGYRLTRADAQEALEQSSNEWQPQSWDEVMTKAKQQVMQELNPFFSELQAQKKQNIERMLDESCPDWRQYEDEMVKLLKDHPTLSKDPAKLYALAVPHDVLESRATQAALKKLQHKTDAGKVGGTSTTKNAGPMINSDKPLSFNEAVAAAKQALASQGIKAPH